VEKVKRWREAGENRGVIVANTTYQIAPWADALFAMDRQWWEVHIDEVNRTFHGARYSINQLNRRYNVAKLSSSVFNSYGNSGAGAINLAAQGGAKRILLLGYDCQRTGGMAHWHGNHPRTLGNAGQIDRWHEKFKKLSQDLSGMTKIINCSRESALTCFDRSTLESEIS